MDAIAGFVLGVSVCFILRTLERIRKYQQLKTLIKELEKVHKERSK
jgi:hypothetical protein